MAHKKKRRPGGHPAKIAARRDRDAQLALRRQNPELAAARGIAQAFSKLDDVFEVEAHASMLLGAAYPDVVGLGDFPDEIEEDHYLDLVVTLERLGDAAALATLWALAEVSSTDVGIDAIDAKKRLLARGVEAPAWGELLSSDRIVRAAEMREPYFDDGFDAVLEIEHGDGSRSAICVFIDNNQGGAARHIFLADSIDRLGEVAERQAEEDGDDLRMKVIDGDESLIAGRILNGIELADSGIGFEPDDDFRHLRAIARRRAFLASGHAPGGDLYEALPSEEEVGAMLDGFATSSEAAALGDDIESAIVRSFADLALSFSVNYTTNDPLCWSPVKLENFMLGWLPRKTISSSEELKEMPAVLTAFVSYAGRKRDLPEALILECAEMVEKLTPMMFEELDSGEAGGPSADFLRAAQEAGVDFADEQAMETFIAGWNARSLLEE